jgi:hypothetical protein
MKVSQLMILLQPGLRIRRSERVQFGWHSEGARGKVLAGERHEMRRCGQSYRSADALPGRCNNTDGDCRLLPQGNPSHSHGDKRSAVHPIAVASMVRKVVSKRENRGVRDHHEAVVLSPLQVAGEVML